MTTEIAETKREMSIADRLSSEMFKAELAKVLPRHVTPERMARVALTALRRTPKLAQCTQESFFKAMLDLSQWGLEPDGRRAHLIPYGKECQLILDYKGIVELVYRSGQVARIHSDIVRDKDDFKYDRGEIVKHEIDFRIKDRGDIYAVYCIVTFKDGAEKCEVMSTEDIEAVRKRSKASNNGPWQTDWAEMAKKTVFRRASKWLPLNAEIRDAMDRDDDGYVTLEAKSQAVRSAKEVLAALPAANLEHDQ
ncbi:recombinase RecT [Stieleria sp.]|uniref:recombinase RecT n=1 Tax=Stieleria sp. TaxID=2795976 RepID=UPI003563091C